MRIQEIEARLAAIRNEIETRGAEMTADETAALETEANTLIEERRVLLDAVEKRRGILDSITNGAGIVTRSFTDDDREGEDASNDPASAPEYRAAWLKNIRNLPLTDAEKRAYTTASGSGGEVIPTSIANMILTKVKTLVPMLGEITLMHVKGNVKIAVEGTNNAAAMHSENANISASADTLTYVSLGGYEIVKLVQISSSVMTMSIDAFEAWIVDMLSASLARKIEDLIFNGTGTNQPKGIDKANTWGATNSVTVAANASLTAANVRALIALLPSGYDKNAKFAMSKKTLFNDFLPLENDAQNKLVTVVGNTYYVHGYPVLLSDYVTEHEAFLGDYTKVCGNLAEDINIKMQYDINTNSYKYGGVAEFDCSPALGEAVVKLAKAAS